MPDADLDALLAVNEAFYESFEQRDLDAMFEVWSHDDHVACTHPGWSTLHGWAAVAAAWFALFQGDAPMQFILTEIQAHVRGDMGWVLLDENLIAEAQGQTVAALNLFERVDGAWRMVLHHGSGVAAQ